MPLKAESKPDLTFCFKDTNCSIRPKIVLIENFGSDGLNMAYVFKNAQGKIVAASAAESFGNGWAFVDDNSKEYLEFLEDTLAESAPFRESDLQMARVVEDLISMLIDKNVIRFTDFPEAAQKRLNDRQSMRKRTQLSKLVDDSDDIIFN